MTVLPKGQRRDVPASERGARPRARPAYRALSRQLRDHTRAAHRRAEQTGVIAEILSRRIGTAAYVLFLRNLLPVYTAMERRLGRCTEDSVLSTLVTPAVYRSQALTDDLDSLHGTDWREGLAVLPSAQRYRDRIAAANDQQLIAHAYVRYLGDLSGGKILQRILRDDLQLSPSNLAFYSFPDIGDTDTFKVGFRRAIDLAAEQVDIPALLEEALIAFELNIALSEEVVRYPGSLTEPRE